MDALRTRGGWTSGCWPTWTPDSPTPTPSSTGPTRARTAGGSRCTPSTCRPTATPSTCRSGGARRPPTWWPPRAAGRHSAARSEFLPTWSRRSPSAAEAKLAAEPIEDLRLDFEDGYGARADEVEDADAVAVAGRLADALAAGAAPAFVGLRFKCFEAPTRRRGLRTLDLFLSTLLERTGDLPAGLVITFPKVSTVSQVEAMVAACEAYESAAGLPAGRLGFEIQVETPPLILGADGTAPVAAAIHAGAGRVTSLHYGTYDYSASLQVSAEYQSMEHPVADYAKDVMQAAVAGTGVHLSDGSTNILPLGTDEQIRVAWQLHHRLVRRSLERAIYQGWDLHPAQLPTRFIANITFYREGFERAATRLHAYLTKSGGGILDEPATARALARYLYRGYVCGAVTDAELIGAVGLDAVRLELLARPKSDTENVVVAARS